MRILEYFLLYFMTGNKLYVVGTTYNLINYLNKQLDFIKYYLIYYNSIFINMYVPSFPLQNQQML